MTTINSNRFWWSVGFLCVAGIGLWNWLDRGHNLQGQPVVGNDPATRELSTPNQPNLPKSAAIASDRHRLSLLALSPLYNESDEIRKQEIVTDWVARVSQDKIPVVLSDLQGVPPTELTRELSARLLRRWAEVTPRLAAVWATGLPQGATRKAAVEQVMITWANQDLAVTIEWFQTLPEDDRQQSATLSLAYEAARAEPLVALDLVSALPPTRERDDLLVYAVSQWAATDEATSEAWATQVTDTSLRQRLVAAVSVASAERDGTTAATLATGAL